ncbi:MAG TPA: hypothetical protein VKF40_13615 [Burkholderiales bacterium]|nr:hypothetical protein [Burkholderiales bacterium]
MPATLAWPSLVAACLALLAASPTTIAAEGRGEGARDRADLPAVHDTISWKFTPTYYRSSNEPNAWDFNLRGNTEKQTWWVGYYRRDDEFQQLRLGYEHHVELSYARLVPSLQYATRGFLGGSLSAEIGEERYFGILGWGRTNLKDYYNLNFDPNDAVTFGIGTRALPNTTLSLFQIYDDRLHTGQRVTHLVARIKPDEQTRWTVDIFHKQGRPDSDPSSEQVRGTGVSVAYDFDRYFVHVAGDPHVNFSNNNMVRVAVGIRF